MDLLGKLPDDFFFKLFCSKFCIFQEGGGGFLFQRFFFSYSKDDKEPFSALVLTCLRKMKKDDKTRHFEEL